MAARIARCPAGHGRSLGWGTAMYFPPGELTALVRSQGKEIFNFAQPEAVAKWEVEEEMLRYRSDA